MGKENPHDRFAKSVMSKIENAKDFFHGVLPEALRELIDLETLRLDKESYVDEELSEYFSDIVYTCRFRGNAVKLVLLFEHKSYVPQYPHLQLLQYKLDIWKRYFRNGKKLPAVLSVVLYHGERKWEKRRFMDCLALPPGSGTSPLSFFIPDFDYILFNLTSYQHAQIEKQLFINTEIKVWLLLQKYIYRQDLFLQHLNSILSLNMVYYKNEEGLRFLRTVLRYIEMGSGLNKNDVKKTIEKTDPLIREEYMTLYEQHIQEGIVKGIVKDKQDVLLKLLS